MYNLAICEDNALHLQYLQDLLWQLEGENDFRIYTFTEIKSFLRAEDEGLQVDILLMDIVIGQDNGIEFVKDFLLRSPATQVIYVTGYINYCTSVYETEHVYFLIKPVEADAFKKAIYQAVTRLKQRAGKKNILVKTGTGQQLLELDSIYYMESYRRKIKFVTTQGTFETYAKNEDIVASLDQRFIRCHKSYIVNMSVIRALQTGCFLLKTGESIPISRQKASEIKKAFYAYLEERAWN